MLQKSIGEIQNQVYGKRQMWDSSWQFHKNRKFNWSGNCANYLFIILTDETGKKLLFVLCKCNINEQWTDKKKLGHVKQTDICHYMVYSNIILNLSISSCYMVNHTCDFKSKLAVCALVRFWNHAYDFGPNCTQFNFTIIYVPRFFIINFSFFTQITVPICHKRM